MLNTSFSPWPSFTPEEAQAVSELLLSNRVNYWTGQECREFEKEFAHWTGTSYAIALTNGTVALDLALKALGIGPGAEVIVTPRSFLASVSCVVTAGATPIFADVDRDSQNMTAETIRAVLSPRTKAILCVHLGGWPCEMEAIMTLANEHQLAVIEDCAQAHGASIHGRMVGSWGNVGAWSFCQDKIMTTGGEGGMVTTQSRELWERMWSYKDHGKSWEAMYERQHPPGFRWVHESFGTNWRMLEMQAVIGRIQLKKMAQWQAQRQANAEKIWEMARQLPGLRVPKVPEHLQHACYKAYVFLKPEALKPNWSRERIMQAMHSQGVPCYSGSCSEIYLEKAFEGTPWRPSQRLPIAKELGETSLMFLVHPTLQAEEIEKTCDVLRQVMLEAAEP